MPNIGIPELLILLLILVLLFGATKLPQIGRGLGEGIRNFRSGIKDSGTPRATDDSHDKAEDSSS